MTGYHDPHTSGWGNSSMLDKVCHLGQGVQQSNFYLLNCPWQMFSLKTIISRSCKITRLRVFLTEQTMNCRRTANMATHPQIFPVWGVFRANFAGVFFQKPARLWRESAAAPKSNWDFLLDSWLVIDRAWVNCFLYYPPFNMWTRENPLEHAEETKRGTVRKLD